MASQPSSQRRLRRQQNYSLVSEDDTTDDGNSEIMHNSTQDESNEASARSSLLHEDEQICTGGIDGRLTDRMDMGDDADEESCLKSTTDDNPTPSLDKDTIEIIILDSTQKKFPVMANPSWTIQELKAESYRVHKCHPSKQRLICMGRLLNDDDTLETYGIIKSGIIIHLFPKPNVVVSTATGRSDDAAESNPTNSTGEEPLPRDQNEENTAHVPQIVLNPEEAERRSNMLLFTSDESQETLNRARLLCFILALHCVLEFLLDIRWLTLIRQIQKYISSESCSDDDETSSSNPPGEPMQLSGTETTTTYYDSQLSNPNRCTYAYYLGFDSADKPGVVKTLVVLYCISTLINLFGIYVSSIGFKATSIHPVSHLPGESLRQARRYFCLLLTVGTFWNILKLYALIYIGKKSETDNYTMHAITAMVWPFLAWCFCYIRAWQLRELIEEAETEAQSRRNENDLELQIT